MQKLVCNAILWTAKIDVPASGTPASSIGLERLKENQDDPVPAKFSEDEIKEKFQLNTASNSR